MLLRDLRKVWISEYETINDHGEKSKKWKFKREVLTVSDVNKMSVKQLNEIKVKKLSIKNNEGIAWLNIQQDINELDIKPSGEVDYSIVNARTTMNYDIQKGNGISLTDISKSKSFVPDYTVSDCPKVGSTTLYKLKQYNGEIEEDEY